MTLYRNTSLHIALRGSGLVRLTDLKGKRVGMSLDRAQSGPGVGQMMRGHGFAYEGDKWEPKFTEFKEVFAGFEQLHTMIGDHLLDATNTIITAGRPLPALSNLMSKQKLVVLRYDGAVIKRLEAELPYLKGVELRAGEVPGLLDEDTLGYDIGGAGTLTVLAGMDEQLAYQIVRIIHKNLDRLAKDCIFFRPAQHNPALFLQDYGIPFHPGAIRYWKEAGLWK